MATTLLLLVGISLLGLFLISAFHAAFTSPLNKIPNAHWSVPLSRLWLLWKRASGKEFSTCHKAHQELGPIVRIGPRELSIDSLDAVQLAYGGSWDKAELYANFVNYGTTVENSAQLRTLLETIGQRLRHKLSVWAEAGESVNMFPVSEAHSMDLATNYIYGVQFGTNWLENEDEASHYLSAFQTVLGQWTIFVLTEIGYLIEPLARIGLNLVSKEALQSLEVVSTFVLDLTDKALENLASPKSVSQSRVSSDTGNGVKSDGRTGVSSSGQPTLQLMQNKILESKSIPAEHRRNILASDLLDQVHAAHEATGIVLTFAMWHLSRNQEIQSSLRSELRSLASQSPPLDDNHHHHHHHHTPRQTHLQSKLLDNILLETMRLHPAAFGPFPRSTPSKGAKMCGFDLPGGTLVNASPYTLGRNAIVFPDPEEWNPNRWNLLDDDDSPSLSPSAQTPRQTKKKRVWIFSSGSRMCLGEHLAVLGMKHFLADVYTEFKTEVARESDMRQVETFIAVPADAALFLRFEKV